MDGVEISALFHGGGLRGVIDGELVQSLELIPGAYGAEHGRGLGGLVRLRTRELPDEGVHLSASADLLDAGAMVTAAFGDRLRIAIGGRGSYLDRILGGIVPRVTELVPIPSYRDYQAKISLALRPAEAIDLVLLGSGDTRALTLTSPDPARVRRESTVSSFHRAILRYTWQLDDGTAIEVTPFFGQDDAHRCRRPLPPAARAGRSERRLRHAGPLPPARRPRERRGERPPRQRAHARDHGLLRAPRSPYRPQPPPHAQARPGAHARRRRPELRSAGAPPQAAPRRPLWLDRLHRRAERARVRGRHGSAPVRRPPGGFRPRDPDATGGFYPPMRAQLGGLTAFALTRVTCNLPDAPIDVAIALEKRYRANENPKLAQLSASVDGAEVALDRVPAGARVLLKAGWSEGDAETYAMFDPGSAAIVERREALRVSWFATAGEITDEVTGRGEDDHGLTTNTLWRAPTAAGAVHLWLVLRDSRGGVDFAAHELEVR